MDAPDKGELTKQRLERSTTRDEEVEDISRGRQLDLREASPLVVFLSLLATAVLLLVIIPATLFMSLTAMAFIPNSGIVSAFLTFLFTLPVNFVAAPFLLLGYGLQGSGLYNIGLNIVGMN